MTSEPLRTLFDPERWIVQIKQDYTTGLKVVDDVVNYGTNLIGRCFESSAKSITDIVIIGYFVKQTVTLLDAIRVLIENACPKASIVQLRALIELTFYLEWILLEDTDHRAKLYFVWQERKQLHWAKVLRSGTVENEKHHAYMKDSPLDKFTLESAPDRLDGRIKMHEEMLGSTELRSTNEEFEKLRGDRERDVAWYVPGGVQSVRDMAAILRREWEYITIYSMYSQTVHSQSFETQVSVDDGKVVLEPIRDNKYVATVLSNSLSYAFGVQQDALKRYRPSEVNHYVEKYRNEWREGYLSLAEIDDGSSV